MIDEDDMLEDEAVIEECDLPDDEAEVKTKLSAAQRHMIANKTPLEANSNYLNDDRFRDAYLKQKVSGKQLVERKQ